MNWRLSEKEPPPTTKPVIGLWFFIPPIVTLAKWDEYAGVWLSEPGAVFISVNDPAYWADPKELPPDPDEEGDDEA